MELLIAAWGALLSTVLVAREVIEWRRGRARLKVSVSLARHALSVDGGEDRRMVRVEDKRGLPVGVALRVAIANSSTRPLQVVSIFFEGPTFENQVIAEGLPAVLEPRTGLELMLQPEWAAEPSLIAVGVLDALGSKHRISDSDLRRLVEAVGEIPVRIKDYRRKEEADTRLEPVVSAFQAFDRTVLVRKPDPR